MRSRPHECLFMVDGCGSGRRGAQIDLVVDRDDGIVNLCEIKYSTDPCEIDAEEAARLRVRKAAFIRETGTRKTCRTTLPCISTGIYGYPKEEAAKIAFFV